MSRAIDMKIIPFVHGGGKYLVYIPPEGKEIIIYAPIVYKMFPLSEPSVFNALGFAQMRVEDKLRG